MSLPPLHLPPLEEGNLESAGHSEDMENLWTYSQAAWKENSAGHWCRIETSLEAEERDEQAEAALLPKAKYHNVLGL